MEDLVVQLGVGGTLAILMVREVLNFLSKKKPGNGGLGNPGHQIIAAIGELRVAIEINTKALDKVIEHDDKQFLLLQSLAQTQATIREDVMRCEKEVRRSRRPHTDG